MPFNRRSFLEKWGSLTSATFLSSLVQPAWSRNLMNVMEQTAHLSPEQLSREEEFWQYVRQAYTVSPSIINFNNAGIAPAPKVVQDAMKRYFDFSNEAPSYFMWRVLDQGREPLRRNLALLAGCDPEEVAIHRSATEALETVIFGLTLQKGDEVVLSKQDYPNMINAWKLRERREGIKLVWVNMELPSEDNEYMAKVYTQAFTPKTKVVHITHMINWNGQILPVRKIAEAARAKGIEVVVDGAQSFAHFQFDIPSLGADYFGTSLHKWLSACVGSGLLYVRKEKIKGLYPLFGNDEPLKDDIRKFENTGTRPFYIEQSIGKAIDFHQMIGAKRKEERLLYLKNYWMSRVKNIPKVRLYTSQQPGFGCAIGLVNVEGKPPKELDAFFFNTYKIHTTPIEWENIKGVRVTPNVYTSTGELDILIKAITHFSTI